FEFRTGFAPVAMRENVMPPNFATGFHLASSRHSPMKERVETRHAHASSRGLDVLEKRGKPSDDFSRAEIFGDAKKFLDRNACLFRTLSPGRRSDFLRRELAFECKQNFPFMLVQVDNLNPNHFCWHVGLTSRLDRLSPHVTNSERENAFGRHNPKPFRASFTGQQFAMPLQGESVRHFQSRPQFIIRSGSDCVSRAQNHMARKWV